MTQASPPSPAAPAPDDSIAASERHLGRALAIIHRHLPRLDDPDRADAVQAALEAAAAEISAARTAHAAAMAELRPAPPNDEILAIIAAAVALTVRRPHRVVDVRTTPAVAWVNAWTIEGRFQHYLSHKVR